MSDLNNLALLKERVRLLESENTLLTQRTEETLMLGLVSEAIERAKDITSGLDAALEHISMLKDLPVVAYCAVNQDKAMVLQSYVSFAHTDINAFSFLLPEMDGSSILMQKNHPHLSHLQIPDVNFTPNQMLLIPTVSGNKTKNVFLFASDTDDDCLQQITPVLERIVHIIAMVIENRDLLKSYKELNEELDYRVELRSKALQESEDKYHALVENSDTSIMLLSDDRFVECNAATLRMFGCDSKKDFLQLRPSDVSPEFQYDGVDSVTAARKHIKLAMETGSDRFDWVHKRINGEEFFAEVNLTRILIQGQMMIQGVVIDIHQRVLTERALHQYKHIVSSSLDMMAILDDKNTYLAANPAYVRAFNKDIDDVVGCSVEELFGQAFLQTTRKVHLQKCLTGEVVHFSEWIDYPAYGLRYMDIHFYPYRNRSGKIIGVVVNGRDDTDRINAEKALQTSEAQYRELIENMQDCVYRTDAEGRLIYASPSIQKLMACKVDEIIGDKLADYYIYPEQGEKLLKLLQTSKNGSVDCFEVQVQRKDGVVIWLSANTHLIYDDQGQVNGVEGSLRDISSLKEMESKFNQAQKMEAVGTLVGGIAHDFNNILAGMVGSLYLMKYKHESDSELLQEIEGLEEQAFRASDMIKQLLSFSRKGIMQINNFSFAQLMQDTFKLAKRTVPENIALRLHMCEEALLVNGDKSLLQQVLMNLINNSRDAVYGVAHPCIDIMVESKQADAGFITSYPEVDLGDCYVHLSIQDNGCGISQDALEHVFEPFYTTKEVGKGTGLGLSMIYGTIQSHKGMISLNSKLDKGTWVDVFLPIAAAPTDDLKKQKGGVLEGHGEVILCVDDENEVCEVNSELLKSFGYKVLQACDGEQALHVFDAHKDEISLVLTDVIMPNLGGVELAKRLWSRNPTQPILFVSGYDEKYLSDISNKLMHINILKKPFSAEQLSQHVSKLLAASASK